MKYRLFLQCTIVAVLLLGCNSESSNNSYTVSVQADGVMDGIRAYLNINKGGKVIVKDSAIVSNGQFEFKGQIDAPEMRTITVDGIVGQAGLVMESGQTEVILYKDSIFKSVISGGKNNKAFMAYKMAYQGINDRMNALRQEFMAVRDDAAAVNAIRARSASIREEMKSFGFQFVKNYPNSDFALMVLDGVTGQPGFDAELANEALTAVSQDIKAKSCNQSVLQNIKSKLNTASLSQNLKIGSKAPDFTAPNPDGDMVTLSKMLGKITILDFWASWCKPCRIENPNFVRIYEKYHNKGLEIISVSLDRENQKQRWVDAIAKDQLNWYNVSNLKFWNDPVAKLYNISSIPATFILDENGIILADRLRGATLEAKIASLLEETSQMVLTWTL